MKSILIAAAAAAALLAAPAFAQAQDVYASAGIGVVDSSPIKLGVATFRVGANFTPIFGVEAEGSFGVSGDKIAGVEYDMNSEYGAFLTLRHAVSENGTLIGRIGYASAEVEASAGPISISDDQSGAAYGIGIQGQIGDSSAIRLDWTRYSLDDDADALSVSFVHTFN